MERVADVTEADRSQPLDVSRGGEGYVVLAMDDARYLDLAANVALSVRRADTRPISVIVNRAVGVPAAYRPLFDRVIVADDEDPLRGAMNKLRLPELTPYERTLYLDADCLLFSPRIAFFWRRYRGLAFAVEGHRQTQGPVFACTVGEKDAGVLCRLLGIPFVGVFNAGVIYFEGDGGGVFAHARALYAGPQRDAISYRYKHAGEYADEPFFGAALGALGRAPLEPKPTQRLQVTTPNLVAAVMDLDTGELGVLKQPARGAPRPWAGVVCHFCGLAPMDRYFALADKLRREAALPPMDRSRFNPVVLTPVTHKEQDAPPP
jgi:hypothetical protein